VLGRPLYAVGADRQAGARLTPEERTDMAARYEYKVEELREGMIGGKMSGSKLEKVLNEHARQGWQLKAITSVEVKGRIGPGGVEGVLVTFERPLG
jgi:predicted ABC-type sugar transport system permease subunit